MSMSKERDINSTVRINISKECQGHWDLWKSITKSLGKKTLIGKPSGRNPMMGKKHVTQVHYDDVKGESIRKKG